MQLIKFKNILKTSEKMIGKQVIWRSKDHSKCDRRSDHSLIGSLELKVIADQIENDRPIVTSLTIRYFIRKLKNRIRKLDSRLILKSNLINKRKSHLFDRFNSKIFCVIDYFPRTYWGSTSASILLIKYVLRNA